MATLKTNLIEPEGATTTLTVGEAGGNLVIGADSLKANLIKAKETITAFTSTGAATWTCPTGVTSVEVLTVAGGGGGGGYYYSGGGGGGGVVHDTAYTVVPAVVYDLTVGAGGAGGNAGVTGANGSDTTWNDNAEGSGVKFIAKGGGGGAGGDPGPAAGAGGSGGGRNWADSSSSGPPSPDDGGASNQQSSGTATGGTVTSYGNIGGGNATIVDETSGNGGGGAGGAGGNSLGVSPSVGTGGGGAGGAGQLFSSFTPYGVSGYFAGGGGGGGGGYSPGGAGGIGGGGAGGAYNQGPNPEPYNGTPGRNGTGGGGGSKSYLPGGSAPNGGTGIVLLKYSQPTGGNILFQSDGSGNVSNVNSGWGGVQVLLSSQTASNSTSLSFTSGIDSTYKEYVFEFINMNPATDTANFNFQVNASGQSGYNETMTTTSFRASHDEADTSGTLTYNAGKDQAQGTAYQTVAGYIGNASDECCTGELHLFNPADTIHIKTFYATVNAYDATDYFLNHYISGYIDVTAAITEIDFKFSSGNIAAGTIKMYGIK